MMDHDQAILNALKPKQQRIRYKQKKYQLQQKRRRHHQYFQLLDDQQKLFLALKPTYYSSLKIGHALTSVLLAKLYALKFKNEQRKIYEEIENRKRLEEQHMKINKFTLFNCKATHSKTHPIDTAPQFNP